MIAVLVAIAGSCGAVARFVVDGALRTRLGGAFPWATIIVNVTGSLLVGVLAGLVGHGAPAGVFTVLGVGFCGGYTTFSTASLESVNLLRQGRAAASVANALATMLLTVAAAWAGLLLTRV